MNGEAEGDDGSADRTSPPSVVYHWNGVDEVPRDVTHVIVDSSVTVIPLRAFFRRRNLRKVELPDGLLKIDHGAFDSCRSLVDINIPHTVTEISDTAFIFCEKLDGVVLPAGLLRLGAHAFHNCESLKRINIPHGIETIEFSTFTECGLVEVALSEGLEVIRPFAFNGCKSLASVNLPRSLKVIDELAFMGCKRLQSINLLDGVEEIGARAFADCGLQHFRVPPQIADVDMNILCGRLVSLELPDNVNRIHGKVPRHAFEPWFTFESLRSVSVPAECNFLDTDLLVMCPSFQIAFPGEDTNTVGDELKKRFDELSIHKICYYQSFHDPQTVLSNLRREINPWNSRFPGQLNATGKQQDCLGMTPLHILACSTKHNLEMIQLLVENYPETLIMKDKWGDVPLLYALWCNAPADIANFLVESYKSIYPEYVFDWAGMVKTLGVGRASQASIENLVKTQQNHFPSQHYELQSVVMDLVKIESLHSQTYAKRCTPLDTFRYLVEVSISERLVSLNVTRWQREIEKKISEISFNARCREEIITTQLYEQLALYELLKASAVLLELALWKAKIGECCINGQSQKKQRVIDQASHKTECRISCGADVVIRNVLAYLYPT